MAHRRRQFRRSTELQVLSAAVFSSIVILSTVFARHQKRKQRKQRSTTTTKKKNKKSFREDQVDRMIAMFASGKFVHPFLHADSFKDVNYDTISYLDLRLKFSNNNIKIVPNFTDLSRALALLCGLRDNHNDDHLGNDDSEDKHQQCQKLREIIGNPKHIIFVLCDGMGQKALDDHLETSSSFCHTYNDPNVLRAVFPSTTPAALTTFATATWPGRHGQPGWDLRDNIGCDYPGQPNEHLFVHGHDSVSQTNNTSQLGPVQIQILNERVMDHRSKLPVSELGMDENDIYFEKPWAGCIQSQSKLAEGGGKISLENQRKLLYVNAYNGDEFPNWYQGSINTGSDTDDELLRNSNKLRSDSFSAWQAGHEHEPGSRNESDGDGSSETIEEVVIPEPLVNLATIQETAYDTIGEVKGVEDAIKYFRHGLDSALRFLCKAEEKKSTSFSYVYTAHPDKHMHALGVDCNQVKSIVTGFDEELHQLSSRISELGIDDDDVALIVTADHGHISIGKENLVKLPPNILDCLEYANIGIFGQGRHAYLHCRSGLQSVLEERWLANPNLNSSFILLRIEDAIRLKLYGPVAPRMECRPRLGDFVAIALFHDTLVTSSQYQQGCSRCSDTSALTSSLGTHGSLTKDEMNLPFVLWKNRKNQ